MKKFFLTIMMAAFAISMNAIPAKRGIWRTITLDDGTQVKVELRGDEYMHFWKAEDGRCFTKNEAGRYELTDHETIIKQAEENRERMRPANNPHRSHYASTADGLGEYGKSGMGSVNSIGEVVIPVVLVEFADSLFKPENTIEKMDRYFNEPGYADEPGCVGSARDYFISQSYGIFKPSFPVVAKVQVSKEYAYYGGNDGDERGKDKNVIAMVREAVKLASEQGVDFTQYYVNGSVPLVSFIYAGLGEASGGDENTIWPHQLDLPSYIQNINGVTIKSYFVGNELGYYGSLDGIGTFCHEFGHGLGLPDFYCTNYSYNDESPFGNWSIMDTGSDMSQGRAPVGYMAYEKSYLGWLHIPELTEEQGVTLGDPVVEGSVPAVLFRNPKKDTEYFIFENRQPGTWYSNELGSGLLVSRFSYTFDAWNSNTLNNRKLAKRAMAIPADKSKLLYTASQSNLYGNSVLNVYEWTLFNLDTYTDAPIFKIMKHDDRTLTFNFMENKPEYTYKPLVGSQYDKVLDVEKLVSGDTIIIVNTEDAIALGLTQTSSARMGTCVNVVDEHTIIADKSTQEIALTKLASGFWVLKVGDVYLTTVSAGSRLVGTAKPDTNAAAAININESGDAEIVFQSRNANNCIGYNIDETSFSCFKLNAGDAVQIFKKQGTTSAIKNISAERPDQQRGTYTLTGQKVDGQNLTKGVYIINGKKTIVK